MNTLNTLEDEYLTVSQMAARFPAFSQGSIRWLIFNGANNNFNRVVRKIGRKTVLSVREFRSWVDGQQQTG